MATYACSSLGHGLCHGCGGFSPEDSHCQTCVAEARHADRGDSPAELRHMSRGDDLSPWVRHASRGDDLSSYTVRFTYRGKHEVRRFGDWASCSKALLWLAERDVSCDVTYPV